MSLRTTITIAGLGYGDPAARTRAVQDALDRASRIVLRTSIHPGIEDLLDDPRVVACDDIYERERSFDAVYAAVVDRIIALARDEPVVYAIPGSPAFGEATVPLLLAAAEDIGLPVTFLTGVDALEPVALAARLDLMRDHVQILDAESLGAIARTEPFSGGQIWLDPTRAAIVAQVFDRRVASELKHALTRIYPEEHVVLLVQSAGLPGESVRAAALCELDHHDVDHLTSVVVPPLDVLDAAASPATLHRIIARLRAPEGCPWDRKQTHASLRDKVIEEAHEVADAIDAGDPASLAEELGDLLLLVALNAQIAEEAGDFTVEDVYRHVNAKLVRRHPHVFGDVVAETPEAVLSTWRAVKAAEKPERDAGAAALPYDRLPRSMSVIERIRRAEHAAALPDSRDPSDIGSRLLALLDEAIAAGIDPERELEIAFRERALQSPPSVANA
jgi:tetrapyrrole methylase family protein/MazG family protein